MNEIAYLNGLNVFQTVKNALDNIGWHYDANEQELRISLGVDGDDIPMDFDISIDSEKEIINLYSHMPFELNDEKQLELSLATNFINNQLIDGSFDYSPKDKVLLFRMSCCYVDSLLSTKVIDYMLDFSCFATDKYNDKLAKLNQGSITLQQCIEECLKR
ncbi:MAG: hypothetical protein IJW13_04815 [Clostridia bacterium]|nr:hypothetical protein [Clostridia bacterium]